MCIKFGDMGIYLFKEFSGFFFVSLLVPSERKTRQDKMVYMFEP